MLVKKTEKVPYQDVRMENVSDVRIQWLISRTDGALNFAMRRFTVGPGGKIGLHDHPWEHEIYILEGGGVAFTEKERKNISSGDVLFVPGKEPHGYENTGERDLIFICMIPDSGDNR